MRAATGTKQYNLMSYFHTILYFTAARLRIQTLFLFLLAGIGLAGILPCTHQQVWAAKKNAGTHPASIPRQRRQCHPHQPPRKISLQQRLCRNQHQIHPHKRTQTISGPRNQTPPIHQQKHTRSRDPLRTSLWRPRKPDLRRHQSRK